MSTRPPTQKTYRSVQPRRVRLVIGGLSALALIASACGSDGPSELGGPTTTAATTVPVTTAAPASTSGNESADDGTTTSAAGTVPPLVTSGDPSAATTTTVPQTTSSPTLPATTTTDPGVVATTLPEPSTPRVSVASGTPVYFSADGEAVIVAALTAELGCEGFPRSQLIRVPLDGSTPTPAIEGAAQDAEGAFVRTGDGRAVIIEQCEGFAGQIFIGDERPDGTLTNLRAIEVTGVDQWYSTPDITIDRTGLIASAMTSGTDSGSERVVRVDLATGVATPEFDGSFEDIVQLEDGGFITRSSRDEMTLLDADGGRIDSRTAYLFALSDDRSSIALFTRTGIEFGPPGLVPNATAPLPTHDPTAGILYGDVTPAGDAAVFSRFSGVLEPVWLANDDGQLIELLPPGEYAGLVISPDGERVAVARADGTDPEAFETIVVELP